MVGSRGWGLGSCVEQTKHQVNYAWICWNLLRLTYSRYHPPRDVVKLRPNCLPGVLSWDLVSNQKKIDCCLVNYCWGLIRWIIWLSGSLGRSTCQLCPYSINYSKPAKILIANPNYENILTTRICSIYVDIYNVNQGKQSHSSVVCCWKRLLVFTWTLTGCKLS